jgi:hypothetical protein
MNCREAREALLVADIAELRGDIETPIAAHLRACAECQRLASLVVRGTSELRNAAINRDAARAARAPRRLAVRRFALAATLPIAAALLLAVVMNQRGERPDRPRPPVGSLPVARQVSLEVARGQRATMLKTADPKVTVIWLSSGEGK